MNDDRASSRWPAWSAGLPSAARHAARTRPNLPGVPFLSSSLRTFSPRPFSREFALETAGCGHMLPFFFQDPSLRSSQGEEAQNTQNEGDPSLVNSAATVQGSKARNSFSAKSLPGEQGKGEGKRFPERYLKIIRHLSEIFRK